MFEEVGLAVASLVGRARSVARGVGVSVGKEGGVSVGTGVLKATGVTNMFFVAAGAGLPSRLLQPTKADSRIARDTKSAALL